MVWSATCGNLREELRVDGFNVCGQHPLVGCIYECLLGAASDFETNGGLD
jgi:hypothetical protein